MKTAVDRKSRETIPLIPTTVQYSAIMCLQSDKLVVVNFFKDVIISWLHLPALMPASPQVNGPAMLNIVKSNLILFNN
jgi:hypothetical protein